MILVICTSNAILLSYQVSKNKILPMSEPYRSFLRNKIHLQIPSNQNGSQNPIRLMVVFLYLVSATSLGFALSTASNMHMEHQIVLIGLPLLLFAVYGGYYKFKNKSKNRNKNKNAYLLKHSYTRTFSILIPLAVFRVPYYSWVFALTIPVSFFWQVYKINKGRKTNDPGLFFIDIIFIFLTFYCLVDEGYLNYNFTYFLQYVLALPFIILFVLLAFSITHDIIRQKKQRQQMEDIYLASPIALILRPFALNLLIANTIILLSKLYLPAWLYINVQMEMFLVTFPYVLFFDCFQKQILVWCTLTRYATHQTVFRVHHRQFQRIYVRNTCNRNIGYSHRQECLLCEDRAVMVNFPCGHLGFCLKCWNRQMLKNIYQCLMCSQDVSNRKQLKFEIKGRQGYDTGKLFIEKKIFKNQYFIQN